MNSILKLQELDNRASERTISTATIIFCASGASLVLCARPAE
ncbi:hypothetical protein [Pseudonocardia sp. TRM90224]|nr:hypothetical protein [Pseudonocardia sp. TRM90224]